MENNVITETKESKKGLKGIILATVTIILIAITCAFFIYSDSNTYVLKINDEKISMAEFATYLKWQAGYMQSSSEDEIIWSDIDEESGVPYIDLAKDLTVDLLTETKVQLQEAEKRNIGLTPNEKEYISSVVNLIVENNEELSSYDLTTEEWIKIYEDAQIADKLALEICNEELTPYDARHILLLTEDKSEEEKQNIKKQAQDLLNKVLAGEDFAKLATQYSEDGGSVNNGGLYEGVLKGAFVSEFENAALSLKDGEIYPELVESSYGYHIIKLEKKISDKKVTQLDMNSYYSYYVILEKWKNDAKVEKGQDFMMVNADAIEG